METKKNRRNFFNENYFEKIDTEEKAYWLGFIAADGYVHYDDYYLSIDLAWVDKVHILKFIECVRYTGATRNKKNTFGVCLYSKKMVLDLIKAGIHTKKSFTVKPWVGPQKLMPHYWRGVFDGDGGFAPQNKIRKSGKVYESWRALLTGNKFMVGGFKQYIEKTSCDKFNIGYMRNHYRIKIVNYSGIRPCHTVVKILLYNTKCLCLDRKKILANKILNTHIEPPIIKHYTTKMLRPLFSKYKSWEKVAIHLNISRNGLYKHIRKLGIERKYRKPWKRKKLNAL